MGHGIFPAVRAEPSTIDSTNVNIVLITALIIYREQLDLYTVLDILSPM